MLIKTCCANSCAQCRNRTKEKTRKRDFAQTSMPTEMTKKHLRGDNTYLAWVEQPIPINLNRHLSCIDCPTQPAWCDFSLISSCVQPISMDQHPSNVERKHCKKYMNEILHRTAWDRDDKEASPWCQHTSGLSGSTNQPINLNWHLMRPQTWCNSNLKGHVPK